MPADLSQHARTLVEQYDLDGTAFQLRVRDGSSLVGTDASASTSRRTPASQSSAPSLAARRAAVRGPVSPGDVLLVSGDAATVSAMASDQGLAFRKDGAPDGIADALLGRTTGVAEVIIPPRSTLIGLPVFPGMVTPSGDLVVLAVQRRGEHVGPAATALPLATRSCSRGHGRRSMSTSRGRR